MNKFEHKRFTTEDGYEIKDIIQIVQYMKGWVVLTKDGSIFSNVNLTRLEDLDKI